MDYNNVRYIVVDFIIWGSVCGPALLGCYTMSWNFERMEYLYFENQAVQDRRWRLRIDDPFKRREMFAQSHIVTSQKTQISKCSALQSGVLLLPRLLLIQLRFSPFVSKALCVPKCHSVLQLSLFIKIRADLDMVVEKYLQNTLVRCVFISKVSVTRIKRTVTAAKARILIFSFYKSRESWSPSCAVNPHERYVVVVSLAVILCWWSLTKVI
jgi:hypothetical protein